MKQVLIVDDSKLLRLMVAACLRNLGEARWRLLREHAAA